MVILGKSWPLKHSQQSRQSADFFSPAAGVVQSDRQKGGLHSQWEV